MAIERYLVALDAIGISLRVRHDFASYVAIRRMQGETHLNQAFDPARVRFGGDDFWLLAQNRSAEPIATYCLRRFQVGDFFTLIRTQRLWFSRRPRALDRRFAIACDIPPFGGEVAHGGGLWVRRDYRGRPRLPEVLPRFARAVALQARPFDHDTAMIRDEPGEPADEADRKARYMGKTVYGFARVSRFVDGWFPPERRRAVMHLCHATREEAATSLIAPSAHLCGERLRRVELGERPFVYQHDQAVDAAAIGGERQHQAGV
jgi:hypothetical protein